MDALRAAWIKSTPTLGSGPAALANRRAEAGPVDSYARGEQGDGLMSRMSRLAKMAARPLAAVAAGVGVGAVVATVAGTVVGGGVALGLATALPAVIVAGAVGAVIGKIGQPKETGYMAGLGSGISSIMNGAVGAAGGMVATVAAATVATGGVPLAVAATVGAGAAAIALVRWGSSKMGDAIGGR